MTALRVAFMGTPDFAVPTLEALLDSRHRMVGVYTQPPRPSGRGHKEQKSPIHRTAEERGVAVRSPLSLKDEAEQDVFRGLALDAAIVVAYGLILPKAILAAPRLGCFNLHPSILPRWRGAAPIERAIMAGDKETAVSIMQMEEGLDSGPVLASERIAIGARTTGGELRDLASRQGAALMLRTLDKLAEGALASEPQSAEGITYAGKIGREDLRIDWTRPAIEIERKLRALSPSPGLHFAFGDTRIKLFGAELAVGAGASPGTVLDAKLTVACGEGALRLTRLQRPGKFAMPAVEFLKGFAVPAGARLS